MSIAGGLFNSPTKRDDAGDTKTTADGGATGTGPADVDLTTAIPGFEEPDTDDSDSFVIESSDGTDAPVEDGDEDSAEDDNAEV